MAVFQALCKGPETVSRLAAQHKMALPSFTQHLGVLEEAGWISSRKEGRVRTCQVNAEALLYVSDWLRGQKALWERRLDQLDDLLLKLNAKKED
jgi:DNA-binding transcriptional ArsR family regulator